MLVQGAITTANTNGEADTINLAAGGTGGHLFPAQALAEELTRRGHVIHLMTDERVRDYGKSFPAAEVHVVHSATITPSHSGSSTYCCTLSDFTLPP